MEGQVDQIKAKSFPLWLVVIEQDLSKQIQLILKIIQLINCLFVACCELQLSLSEIEHQSEKSFLLKVETIIFILILQLTKQILLFRFIYPSFNFKFAKVCLFSVAMQLLSLSLHFQLLLINRKLCNCFEHLFRLRWAKLCLLEFTKPNYLLVFHYHFQVNQLSVLFQLYPHLSFCSLV